MKEETKVLPVSPGAARKKSAVDFNAVHMSVYLNFVLIHQVN